MAACDGTNPFMTATAPDGSTEPLEPGDPNTTVSSKFLWDPARSLTMNSVVYDEATDTLTINNLPFDGPDGKYDHVADAPDGTPIYASRQTSTTGLLKHYALFLRSDYIEATAAGSGDWGDYGNAGANVNRSSFSLPSSGEYVYVGDYAGLRTFDEKGGIELVTGDMELILDILDFDPLNGIQGDIIGTITNRTRVNVDGTDDRDLPDVYLKEVSFDSSTGVFEGGAVESYRPDNGDPWSTGTYDGMLAGPDAAEVGAYLIMEGLADIQIISYQVVDWTLPDGSSGTASGLDTIDADAFQDLINAGGTLPTGVIAAVGVPAGATIVSDTVETQTFETEYKAQEIGVLVGDQVIP